MLILVKDMRDNTQANMLSYNTPEADVQTKLRGWFETLSKVSEVTQICTLRYTNCEKQTNKTSFGLTKRLCFIVICMSRYHMTIRNFFGNRILISTRTTSKFERLLKLRFSTNYIKLHFNQIAI